MKRFTTCNISTLALFCCVSLLTLPVAAETLQTPKSEISDPTVVNPPEIQASVSSNTEQKEAQQAYERKSLYALRVNLPTLALETDYLNDSWFEPKNGSGYLLSNEEFYELLGNPELIEQYNAKHRKNVISTILIGSGALGALSSGIWIFLSSATDVFTKALGPAYSSSNNSNNMTIPVTVFALSSAAIIAGIITRPDTVHPLKINEAAKILDQYNKDLKQDLGLPQDLELTRFCGL